MRSHEKYSVHVSSVGDLYPTSSTCFWTCASPAFGLFPGYVLTDCGCEATADKALNTRKQGLGAGGVGSGCAHKV